VSEGTASETGVIITTRFMTRYQSKRRAVTIGAETLANRLSIRTSVAQNGNALTRSGSPSLTAASASSCAVAQSPSEHLADHRLRQVCAEDHLRRNLVRRQRLPAEGPELILADRLSGAQHDPRAHRFALPRVRDAGHADFAARRMRRQRLLHLARPHLVAAGLDQILLAVDDEQVAIVVQVAEVAGVEPPDRRTVSVGVLAQHERRFLGTL